jgi:rhodanese-related sulfurtransferase
MDPEWEVSVQEVNRMQDAGEPFVLIDVRERDEHALVNIDGAKLFPLSEFKSQLPHIEEFADDKVVLHCHHGQRSLQAAVFLRQQGFEDVKSMAGGIDVWAIEIDPSKPRY